MNTGECYSYFNSEKKEPRSRVSYVTISFWCTDLGLKCSNIDDRSIAPQARPQIDFRAKDIMGEKEQGREGVLPTFHYRFMPLLQDQRERKMFIQKVKLLT
jgi:hypothetical protein